MNSCKHRLSRIKILRVALFLSFLLPGILIAQRSVPVNHTNRSQHILAAKLDELMTAYEKTSLFSGSVLIQQGDQLLLHKGYGFSDLATRKKNQANSKFAIYSVTKPVTATVILRLVQDGKLQLDDKLSVFFPSFPAADSITIENLLTHTSGLYNYNNDYTMPVETEDSMISFLKKRQLDFPPGTEWSYCNTGYFLLGFIIQKITGLTFEDAVNRYVFRPLGMNNSGFDYRSLVDKNKTTGYVWLYPDTGKAATLYREEELFSAGGIWSASGDLYKFHKGMEEHRIIDESLTSKAYKPFKANYGYGWFIDSVSGKRVVSHSGGAAGFRSYLVRIPETNTCIVLLSNNENSDVTAIKNKLLRVLFNQPYTIPAMTKVKSSTLSKIQGTYHLEPGRSFYVSMVGKNLTGTISGQSTVLLLPQPGNRFFVEGLDGSLGFIQNKEGRFDTLVLYRKDKKYTGIRIESSWGITGSAAPNGWDGPDQVFQQSVDNKNIWTLKNTKLADGMIKFRYNNDWTFNYGAVQGSGELVPGGNDIPVKAGTYNIWFDLTDKDKPVYRITRID